jgi:hypothetical protein
MWNDGEPMKAIADELGYKHPTSIGQDVHALRAAGRIGHRYEWAKERAA